MPEQPGRHFSLSHTHTHTHALNHARTHARARAHPSFELPATKALGAKVPSGKGAQARRGADGVRPGVQRLGRALMLPTHSAYSSLRAVMPTKAPLLITVMLLYVR